jgi:glucose-1-phosphate adenylyltransferase
MRGVDFWSMRKSDVLTIVLGGGKGTRLYPLTKERAKPAVPFGAKYRLVDIPLSNSINAGFRKIYVLTQFNTASLHLHIGNTYLFDSFTKGFVEILAAEQTFESSEWYEGTGDAVRKNLVHFRTQQPSHYLILSGDQLYRMDLDAFLRSHVESGQAVSIAVTPVNREQAGSLGLVRIGRNNRIEEFWEKPGPDADITRLRFAGNGEVSESQDRPFLASMGIYCFDAGAMESALDSDLADFGKEIIPSLIGSGSAHAYIYRGYWEDIGTIKSFYEANLNLASTTPSFNFYVEDAPIYTHRRDLAASKFNKCTLTNALTADGCIITNSSIVDSLVGIRTIIDSDTELSGVVCMGADFYETEAERRRDGKTGIPAVGIGHGTRIHRAIIDKNARIGEGCAMGLDVDRLVDGDYGSYHIRDGIIIVLKNSVIPDGTVI